MLFKIVIGPIASLETTHDRMIHCQRDNAKFLTWYNFLDEILKGYVTGS